MKKYITLLLAGSTPLYADLPQFEDPITLKVGDSIFKTESPGYASPTMVDLDNDGLKDLVVGQFKDGAMVFLKNTGEAKSPKFEKQSWVMTNDQPAQVNGVW